jgi:hypothetical protein
MDRATAIAGLQVVAETEAWCVARGEHVYVVVLDGSSTTPPAQRGSKQPATTFAHAAFRASALCCL